MKIAIIQFPGSNCERETMLAVKRAGMEPVEFLWNEDKEKLRGMDGYIIVGGFSYEDRSRAGIIAALDPIMQEIKAQSENGKPVLGICNGAQILVETGMVPGLAHNKVGMALTENKRVAHGKIVGTGYYNTWVHLRLSAQYQRNAFTSALSPGALLQVPIAHAEGRFVMTAVLLQEIEQQGLNVFQYCDANGVIDASFPVNPNGSIANIAAISNKAGNVMAMMPHPERTVNGDPLFASMRDYIAKPHFMPVMPLSYGPRLSTLSVYQAPPQSEVCLLTLMITDNHALTVQNTLHQLGLPVTVKRYIHWEIQGATAETMTRIMQSGVLYNDRKERPVNALEIKQSALMLPSENKKETALPLFLVHAKEDVVGEETQQLLHNHFAIKDIPTIKHSVLWHFSSKNVNIGDLTETLLSTNIIFNPYAHDCYYY